MCPKRACPTRLVLVNSSCHNKILQTGGLNNRNVFSHSIGRGYRFPRWLSGKESAPNSRDTGNMCLIPGLGRSPGGGNGNPLCILAWKIPWTEEPGGLQSLGSHRVGHNWNDLAWHSTICFKCRYFKMLTKLMHVLKLGPYDNQPVSNERHLGSTCWSTFSNNQEKQITLLD